MPLLSRLCNHAGCKHLIFAQDACNMHKRKIVVHKKTRRIISILKDGTRVRAYKQCTHKQCGNIAKKFGKCYRHGAPRSGKVCKADKEMLALVSEGYMAVDKVDDKDFWEDFVKEFTCDIVQTNVCDLNANLKHVGGRGENWNEKISFEIHVQIRRRCLY